MNILLVTTRRDMSLPSLRQAAAMQGLDPVVAYYDQPESEIKSMLEGVQANFLYYRDPFNDSELSRAKLENTVKTVTSLESSPVFVDAAKSFSDMLIEDKWRQYQFLGDLMPATRLLRDHSEFIDNQHIAKPRLSSRGRGIALKRQDLIPGQKYIIQPFLTLKREYRVYGIHGSIVPVSAVCSSKTVSTKVKVIGIEKISDKLTKFAAKVYSRVSGLQFVGFDIAITAEGRPVLLEINRSPQFSRYNEVTDTNLANDLMKGLL